MSDLQTIKNIGPAFAKSLGDAGISTAEELRTLGSDTAYAMMLRAGTPPHFIGYYVLVMALQGRPWNDCKGEEKIALRKRFDAIKEANVYNDTGVEAILNTIGTGIRRHRP
ncbi:TfoX/Sxy family DNA transformation protein [Nereida sp. MMG025]|uniref:TfoX/Sxy family DNA transformation protein n=1 Tax=Nereida sp. MMG025 TaxID=2909981 RepID=UPI001F17EA3A|nr:TfoX/Sxy family DNA transformation protein [Nereida sp. MMG025]MCF6443191.1 TfoX/Sxy family protein [Nereida sp. MMG025]